MRKQNKRNIKRNKKKITNRAKSTFRKIKDQLTSAKGPIFYGAFYKDDTQEGFNFAISADKYGDETQSIINSFISTSEEMYNDSKKWDEVTKVEQIAACRRHLIEDIKEYNKLANIPASGRIGYSITNLSPEAVRVAFMISTSIHFLTMLGDIENDNYNGMHFMYDDMKIVA
tara:strand:- start:35 stop:550 length:516 start_codon:yes stop_codon:yes gene_type:complete